jgi:misacylated tRNA(Ala) deacylase
MTDLLYQTDSYLQEFDAHVTSVLSMERAIVLDRTAFYPGGGGQPCDFGTLTVDGTTYPVAIRVDAHSHRTPCFVRDNLSRL